MLEILAPIVLVSIKPVKKKKKVTDVMAQIVFNVGFYYFLGLIKIVSFTFWYFYYCAADMANINLFYKFVVGPTLQCWLKLNPMEWIIVLQIKEKWVLNQPTTLCGV